MGACVGEVGGGVKGGELDGWLDVIHYITQDLPGVMHMQTTLRSVGGSIAMTIPKAIVDELGLRPEAKVELVVEGGQMIMRTNTRPRYKLDDLLAKCDPAAARDPELDEWLNAPSVGHEVAPE